MKFDLKTLLDNLNKLDTGFKYAIFVGILLLILLADLFVIIWPLQINVINKTITDTQSLKENLDRLKTDSLRIDHMKNGLNKNKLELEGLTSRIRSVQEIPSIIEDLSSMANKFGVKIDQITPQTDNQKSLVSNESIKYYSLPIVIDATSSYHMFGKFINSLEQGKLMVTLNSFSIEHKLENDKLNSVFVNLKLILFEKLSEKPKK